MILRSNIIYTYIYIHYTRFRRAVLSHRLSRVWVEARVPRGAIKEIIIIQKNNKEESCARETRPAFIHYNILYKMQIGASGGIVLSEYTCARSQITNLHPIIVLTRRQYTLTHTHTGSRSVDSHSRLVIFIIIIIIIIAQSFDLVSYAQSVSQTCRYYTCIYRIYTRFMSPPPSHKLMLSLYRRQTNNNAQKRNICSLIYVCVCVCS